MRANRKIATLSLVLSVASLLLLCATWLCVRAYGVQYWTAKLGDENFEVRAEAATRLGHLGERAQAAVPDLVARLEDAHEEVRAAAAKALGRIGQDDDVVPSLADTLGDESDAVRSAAAEALGELGPDAEPAVPQLVQRLHDEHWGVREKAGEALGKIGSFDRTIPLLLGTLNHENSDARGAAAETLGRFGSNAQPAVEALISALAHDSAFGVRCDAAEALGKIGPAARVVPPLADALEDDSWILRSSAARALAGLGGEAKDAVPALMRALEDEYTHDPLSAYGQFVLRSLTLPFVAYTGVSATDLFCRPDLSTRHAIICALGDIGPEACPAIPKLTPMLDHPNQIIRKSAAEALTQIQSGHVAPKVTAVMSEPPESTLLNTDFLGLDRLGAACVWACALLFLLSVVVVLIVAKAQRRKERSKTCSIDDVPPAFIGEGI